MIFRTGSIKLTVDNIITPSPSHYHTITCLLNDITCKSKVVSGEDEVTTTEINKMETESDVLVLKRKAKA